ncbi:MAG: OadG family protein [Lachnospiraceae bacterium]
MSTVAAFITWDSDIMAQAGLNTILGIGIVFCVLILFSFIISCFKYINKIGAPKQKKEPARVETPAAAPVIEEDVTDDLEIVAVITAAIEAYEEEMGGYVPADGLVVRSIKKVNKQRWQNA